MALEGAPSLFKKLERVAMRVDPAIDAAAINAAMPDDAVHNAAKKAKQGDVVAPGGVNALFNVTNQARMNNTGALTFVGGDGSDQPSLLKPIPKSTSEQQSGFDSAMQKAESAFGYVAFAPLATEMALPALGGVAGWLGMSGMKNTLNAPAKYLNETKVMKNVTGRQALNDGIQSGFSALQTYGVAKGFVQNMASLKEMYADITGKDPRSVSTMEMLTASNLPPLIADARNHFIKEYGTRGLVQAVGWGLVARDFLKGKARPHAEIEAGRIGIVAGIVPGIVGMGVDMFMGTSTTEVYSGFKKAFQTGQPIPANEYAAFILASNHDLAKRRVGKQVAMEIGNEYAEQHVDPGEILRQMSDGRFNAKIEQLIVKDEAELAQKDAAKAQRPEQKSAAKGVSMVDKAKGAKSSRPILGDFTAMISGDNKGVARTVT